LKGGSVCERWEKGRGEWKRGKSGEKGEKDVLLEDCT